MKKLKVDKNFKMAQRIQPDRQVKKKRKLEKPKSFDILGNFLYNYGLTGQNLAHDIFSYLDFPSIQDSHLVCKSWSIFLSNDRKLWMDILRQTQPFFEFLSNQFLNHGNAEDSAFNETKKNWKKFFDAIEILSQNDNFSCQKMIQLYMKIQVIHAALQGVIHDCPIYKVFQKEFIGRKLYEEIQSEIDRANEIVPNRFKFESGASFWPGLQRKIVVLQDLQDYLYLQKQADDRPPNYICLGCGTDCYHDLIQTTQKDIQDLQREILLWIEIEFNTVC